MIASCDEQGDCAVPAGILAAEISGNFNKRIRMEMIK